MQIGISFVGGIAGSLLVNNSILLNSSFTVTVHATEDISGGLIGWLAATGRITGQSKVGGLIGGLLEGWLIIANFDTSTQLTAAVEMNISIYPNPFGESVNIRSKQAIRSILVYNMKGQVMQVMNIGGVNDINLSTGDFAKGIYVFMIEDISGNRLFRRLVRR